MADEKKKKSAIARLATPELAEDELPEPEAPSFLSRLASAAPALAVGIGHIANADGGTQESRSALARLSQQGNEEIAAKAAQYSAQTRANARNRQQQAAARAAAERQGKMDADTLETNKLRREETGLNIQKGRRAEAEAAELDDPSSNKNVVFRQELAKREPELWNSLPEERRNNLRLKDADSIAMSIEESKRQKGNQDKMMLETHKQREELKYNTNLPGGYGYNPGPATGQPGRASQDAAAAYGGADKVPAHIAAAARTVDEAFAAGRRDTPQLHTALMDDVAADLQRSKANTAAEGKADEALRRTESMEDKDYSDARQRRNLDNLRVNIDAVKKELAPYLGPDGRPRKNIPGYGATGWLPNFLKSEEGKSLAQAYARLQDTELRAVSGAAAPEQEVQRFGNIMGTGPLSTDKDLINALEKAEAKLAQQESLLDAGRPVAAKRFRERLAQGTPPAAHANQKGGPDEIVQVRNAAGETMPVKRKNLARAKADGFQEVK